MLRSVLREALGGFLAVFDRHAPKDLTGPQRARSRLQGNGRNRVAAPETGVIV